MNAILSAAKALAEFRFRSRSSLELEIIALRHQLQVIKKDQSKRVLFGPFDRLLWVILYRFWPDILRRAVVIKPDTIIRWHYAGFRLFWRYGSRNHKPGTPPISAEMRDLIYLMKRDNPIWGSTRIAAEMRKIGYKLSPVTVYRYLRKYRPKFPGPPSPGWRAFFANQLRDCAAVDFFVVVTINFQLLYGMVVLSLGRRKIIHFATTAHPKQEWVAEQFCHCFSRYPKPKFILRDRDSIYGSKVQEYFSSNKIEERITTKSWQNGHVERLIYSLRRECLDHVIIYDARHLHRMLQSYVNYYNFSRTHYNLDGDCPVHRPIERPIRGKKIVAIPQVGGLHHRYERRAA